MKKRVAVAMSGGVDSSLTAALLQKQGFDVFGATMLVSEESEADAEEAKAAADDLGIEHFTFDFKQLFHDKVIKYFLQEYLQGHTPNPCVECNRHLKFGAFWESAVKLGAEFMATGHYVRSEKRPDGKYVLRKGIDEIKDQSYMLWHLQQNILTHCIFPLGGYQKSEVRKIAVQHNLKVADKPESQDICFIPDGDYRQYLRKKLPGAGKKGKIVDVNGNVLGEHEGLPFYTVGQRKGLGIAYKEPLFVVRLDADRNEVIVGTNSEVFSQELTVSGVNWIDGNKMDGKVQAEVKVRYSKKAAQAEIVSTGNNECRIIFVEPQRAITSGQSAVFYDKDRLLGGGIIC